MIAQHINFTELAALVDAFIERGDGRKGGRPAYPTEVMVRILVLKRLASFLDRKVDAFYKHKLSKMQVRLKAA